MELLSLNTLIEQLKANGVLKSPAIERALRAVDRARFMQQEARSDAYADKAFSIGFGQTISQPYTVVFMLELLEVGARMKIFEVGSGSGWQTALLAYLVGPSGRVYTTEIIPELYEFGYRNASNYPELLRRIEFRCVNAANGLPQVARMISGFDRAIAAASVTNVPEAWRSELKVGGTLVYPTSDSIIVEKKRSTSGDFSGRVYPGFAFVPFVES